MSSKSVCACALGTNLAPWGPEFLMAKQDCSPEVLLSAHTCMRTVESEGAQDVSWRGVVWLRSLMVCGRSPDGQKWDPPLDSPLDGQIEEKKK